MRKKFKITNNDIAELIKCETKFEPYIKKIGKLKKQINTNIFESLITAIVSQQISGKVASAITNRLIKKVKKITPKRLLDLTDDEFKIIGIGPQKRGYIKAISLSFKNGDVNELQIKKMSNKEVVAELTKLKGVGEWTAEMLLIFSLGRKNVISFKDLGIKKGIVKLYNKNGIEEITPIFFEKCKKKYGNYATLASFFLWEIASLK